MMTKRKKVLKCVKQNSRDVFIMRYNSSGFYEEKLSLIGIGTDFLPKNEKGEPDAERCSEYFKAAFEKGVTLFFVPSAEDESIKNLLNESFLKKARNEYLLSGSIDIEKISSGEEAEAFFKNQLDNLKSGYFDYYVIENISPENFEKFENSKIFEVFSKLKEFGKIKHLGFSFFGSSEFGKNLLKKYQWDFSKINLNFCLWEKDDITDFYHALRKKRIPFIASDPFMGGMILDPPEEVFDILKNGEPLFSMEEWALRWFFDKKGLLCIETSPKTAEDIIKYSEIISSPKTLNSSKKHFLKIAAQKFSEEKCEGTCI